MATFYGLIVSFILQFVAAFIAISLTKLTKYNLSWILISIALFLTAIRRLIEFLPYMFPTYSKDLSMLSSWTGIGTSVLITVSIIFIKKIFKSLKEADKIRKLSERRVLNAIIQTEEKERKRFAKDMHDGLGPILSTVKMSFSALQKSELTEKVSNIINNTSELIEEAINGLKEISENLSPHILSNFGLESMLRTFVNRINYAGRIRIHFSSNLNKERFQTEVEIILFRAICELINNTIRHAEASNAILKIFKTEDMMLIHYKDDGKGFDPKILEKDGSTGSGFNNIHSRLQSVNGRFSVESIPGSGMEAEIVLKLKDIRK
ncbi:MAG: sensor histidine kinase [Bacteroidetes bacterium]|nr:sensor histidine kinase [Bacteroidota bacterium]